MNYPLEQVNALKTLGELFLHEEGGKPYFLIRGLNSPNGVTPAKVDVLLCPWERDGYPSRLFFSEQVRGKNSVNWNKQERIVEQNWHAYSYKVLATNLSLLQLVSAHLGALTK